MIPRLLLQMLIPFIHSVQCCSLLAQITESQEEEVLCMYFTEQYGYPEVMYIHFLQVVLVR